MCEIFKAFAGVVALAFLTGFTSCEQRGDAADAQSGRPGPSQPATAPLSPLLVGNATPSATVAATATAAAPAATASATGPAPSASPAPSAAIEPNPGPTPVPVPHFASAAANEYVQAYETYMQNFRAAYIRMMKDADLSDYNRLIVQAQELQARGEQVEEELDPGERDAFGKYLDAKAEEVRRITSEAL